MYWKLVSITDGRARALADRHYSRRSVGSPWFTPPGNNIVLLGVNDDALWVSNRVDPTAPVSAQRKDGFRCWTNPYFRNESGEKASELIREALAVTLYMWGDPPPDGFHTFIDPAMVSPIETEDGPLWGYCYLRARFRRYPELTKERGFIRLVMSVERLRRVERIAPLVEQMRLAI